VKAHPGAGLGLALARWIVNAHGGEIAVASEVDIGTCFTVSLPLASNVTGPVSGTDHSHPITTALGKHDLGGSMPHGLVRRLQSYLDTIFGA
jgi:hypothetical protein